MFGVAADLGWGLFEAAEGAAGRGVQAAVLGGTAATAAGYGAAAMLFKRRRTDGGDAPVPEVNNLFQVGQYCKEVNLKRGSKKKKSSSMILKHLNNMMQHMVSRWQSLLITSGLDPRQSLVRSFILDNRVDNTLGAGNNKHYLPMYAFNLTALSLNRHNIAGTVDTVYTVPFYRLYKDDTNRYRWIRQPGANNDPSGLLSNFFFSIEDTNAGVGGSASRLNQIGIDDYNLDWVNIRTLIMGAQQRDTEIDFYEMQFTKDGAGPNRQYVDKDFPAVFINQDVDPTGTDENEITAFYDHYFASRTRHPFLTTSLHPNMVEKPWKILRHKKVNMPIQPSAMNIIAGGGASGTGRYTVCHNFFHKYDKDIKLRSDNYPSVTSVSQRVVSVNKPQAGGFVDYNSDYNMSVYQPRNEDRWFVISAKVYDSYWLSDAEPADTVKGQLYPSFDIQVRQKVHFIDNQQ